MPNAWELVLHHTYAGTPGVIFDHSPSRRSHGLPVNLSNADFLVDGASPGTGAVRLSKTSMIRVPASQSWDPLGAVRIEMVCRTDTFHHGGILVTGDSFSFDVSEGVFFGGSFAQTSGGFSTVGQGGTNPRPLPAGQWMTLALQYDLAGVHVEFNGDVVQQWESRNGFLNGTSGLVIGNDYTGQHGLTGAIDDVKIWRLNPHAIGNNFVERPVDDSVGRCWAEWSRRLDEVLKSDPRCGKEVVGLLQNAMIAVTARLADTPNIEPALSQFAIRYQELWSQGRLDEIPAVLADVIALLRRAGFNPAQIAEWQSLQSNSCFAAMSERLPINCDVAFTSMFSVSESF